MKVAKLSVRKRVFLVVGTVISVMWVGYIFADREQIVLSDAVREEFGGDYVKLPCGVTHYERLGDNAAPMVVLLHGSTLSIWDFDLQVETLLNAGFQILRYDALGRGLSDRPDVDYTRDLYVTQLLQVLDALEINEQVILLGHSLGGAIAMEFTSRFPSKVRGVALLSPVINSVHSTPPFVICNTPIIGDFLLRVAMLEVLRVRANGQWAGVGVNVEKYDRLFRRQASIEGFEHAVCSMFRTDLVGDYRATFRKVGKQNIPGLIVYGEDDPVIWSSDVEALRPQLKSFSFEKIQGGKHSTHVQNRSAFDRILLTFLNSISAR
ncbi:MAG: alpha/beta hydrolase [Deltaproteobacteria bacterium]|nr:alpha/beta hydrolase [Deltaproteobacteria bacterium]MBN2670862.1 alpha/beta hydrolase [Deltaproteobacteria bacterium]